MLKKLVLSVVLSLSALAASAVVVVDDTTKVTRENASNVDFGTTAVSSGVVYTDGFATFEQGSLMTVNNGLGVLPAGGSDAYWSIWSYTCNCGSTTYTNGPGTLSFESGVAYVGFLWGSPDLYNKVTFWSDDTQIGSYTGADITKTQLGKPDYSAYFNFYAEDDAPITKVTFNSTGRSLETDNFSYSVSAVPEPSTALMMLVGALMFGSIAIKRQHYNSRQ